LRLARPLRGLAADFRRKIGFFVFQNKVRANIFSGSLAVCFLLPLQSEASRKGAREEFRPPSQSRAKSVRIFSNTHRFFPKRYHEKLLVKTPFRGGFLKFFA